MAMTVTATMSGAAANEHIYLQVKVLTGATEAGGASTASLNASGGASAGGNLTPNGTNSLPVFAITADNPGVGAFTALTNNTIYSSNVDSDDWLYGFGFFSGTVTSGTPVAFGGSDTSSDYTTWACYEVLASGGSTPTVDGSSPALASATGAGIKTVTSASFTPPAGSVVVAMVCGGGSGSSGSFVMTITNTGGLTFTQRAAAGATVTDQDTFVFTATVPATVAASLPARPWRAGGATRLRRQYAPKRHPLISVPPPVGAADGAAALDGAGVLSTAATVAPAAALAGAGSLTAVVTPYIAGLGGTGAGYFADQGGRPRMVLGDAVWGLPGNAGRWSSGAWQSDFDTYLATRSGQGFTVIYCKPIGTTQSGCLDDNGKTFDSLYPFQGGAPSTGTAGANPSSGLTASFWARIDYLLNSALAKGLCVFLNAIGYSSDFDSGPGPLAGKSSTEFQAYGAALGARYAAQGNVFWHLADDYFSDNDSLISAFLTGLRGAGASQPVSIENMPESDSRNTFDASPTVLPWGTSNAAYNFCYSYNTTYVGVEKAYLESSPIPVVQGDGYFYQGNSTYAGGSGAFAFDRAIRQDAWHAISSGARGIIHGSESTWQWQSTAAAASSSDWYFVHNAGVIRSVMEALPGWETLVPDTSSALITSGRGTHATTFSSGGGGGQYEVAFSDVYVTGSRTPDSGSGSSLAVIYLSHGTTIGIDQTKMVTGYTVTWYDPVSGAATPGTPGSSYNSTAQGNNSQGDPDWVLVLQAPVAVTVQGTAALVGAGTLATAETLAAPGTLDAAGTLAAGVTQGAPTGLTAGGTLADTAVQGAPTLLSGGGRLGTLDITGAPAGPDGAGVLATAATLAAPATLDGAGTLAAAVTLAAPAALDAAGVLAAAATEAAPAVLDGAGSLGTVAGQGSGVGLDGAGTLATADVLAAPATLDGAGVLATAVTLSVPAALDGAGTLTAASGQGSVLDGAGTLNPPAILAVPALLTAAGVLAGTAAQGAPTGLDAAATLNPPAILAAPAVLGGAGVLTSSVVLRVAALIAAAGAISAAAGQGSGLAGLGTLNPPATTAAPATLTAAGVLAASVTAGAVTALDAAGTLAATPAGGTGPAATLTGRGSILQTILAAVRVGSARAGAYPVGTVRAGTTPAGTVRAGTTDTGDGQLTAGTWP